MAVKRFDFNPYDGEQGMQESTMGDYVTHFEYALLLNDHKRLCEALESAIERIKEREFTADLRARVHISKEDFHKLDNISS